MAWVNLRISDLPILCGGKKSCRRSIEGPVIRTGDFCWVVRVKLIWVNWPKPDRMRLIIVEEVTMVFIEV